MCNIFAAYYYQLLLFSKEVHIVSRSNSVDWIWTPDICTKASHILVLLSQSLPKLTLQLHICETVLPFLISIYLIGFGRFYTSNGKTFELYGVFRPLPLNQIELFLLKRTKTVATKNSQKKKKKPKPSSKRVQWEILVST